METSTARRTPFSFPVDRWHRIIALLESVPIYRQLASDLRASVAVATRSDTPENAHESLTLTTESAVHADAIRMAASAIARTEADDRREAGFAIGDRVRYIPNATVTGTVIDVWEERVLGDVWAEVRIDNAEGRRTRVVPAVLLAAADSDTIGAESKEAPWLDASTTSTSPRSP